MASNAQTELQSSALRSELPLLEPANVAYRGTTWYQEVTPRFRHRRLHGNSLVTSRDSAAAIFCLQEARWGELRESPPHRRRRKRRRWVKAPPTILPPPAPPPPTPPSLFSLNGKSANRLLAPQAQKGLSPVIMEKERKKCNPRNGLVKSCSSSSRFPPAATLSSSEGMQKCMSRLLHFTLSLQQLQCLIPITNKKVIKP